MKKGWNTFIRCYTIALNFWDKFNAKFVFLYFSLYNSIKMWHHHLKNVEKNNKAVHLRLSLLIFSKTISILRNYCLGTQKKIVHLLFCVFQTVHLLFCAFQTKLNKAVSTFCRLPEWIRNVIKKVIKRTVIKRTLLSLHTQ